MICAVLHSVSDGAHSVAGLGNTATLFFVLFKLTLMTEKGKLKTLVFYNVMSFDVLSGLPLLSVGFQKKCMEEMIFMPYLEGNNSQCGVEHFLCSMTCQPLLRLHQQTAT